MRKLDAKQQVHLRTKRGQFAYFLGKSHAYKRCVEGLANLLITGNGTTIGYGRIEALAVLLNDLAEDGEDAALNAYEDWEK
jgi:hypothetical protein